MPDECPVPGCHLEANGSGLCPNHGAEQTVALGDIEVQREADIWEHCAPAEASTVHDLSGVRLARGATKYGRRALQGLLSDAQEGDGRNNSLTRVGFRVGQLIQQGHLHPQDAFEFCDRVGKEMGLPDHEIRHVIHRRNSAIARGMKSV